jgi:hypothetical protein
MRGIVQPEAYGEVVQAGGVGVERGGAYMPTGGAGGADGVCVEGRGVDTREAGVEGCGVVALGARGDRVMDDDGLKCPAAINA